MTVRIVGDVSVLVVVDRTLVRVPILLDVVEVEMVVTENRIGLASGKLSRLFFGPSTMYGLSPIPSLFVSFPLYEDQ